VGLDSLPQMSLALSRGFATSGRILGLYPGLRARRSRLPWATNMPPLNGASIGGFAGDFHLTYQHAYVKEQRVF
jgi:hypothetical protein